MQRGKGTVDHQAPGSTVHRLDGTEVLGISGDTEPWHHWAVDRQSVGTLVLWRQRPSVPWC